MIAQHEDPLLELLHDTHRARSDSTSRARSIAVRRVHERDP